MKGLLPDAPEDMALSRGWMWRCFRCGQSDGTFIDPEHCEAAAKHHRDDDCPN